MNNSPKAGMFGSSGLFEDTDIKSVAAAIISISVVGTGLGLSGPLLSLLMEKDGLSSTLIGANTAIAGLAALVAVPFVTQISIRIGVVNTLIANIALASICLMAFYYFDPIPGWFILRFVFSVNLSMTFVLSEFWINNSTHEKNRGLMLGIYGTMLSVGFAGGPAIIALTGIDGILPFLVGAAIIFSACLPIYLVRSGQPAMKHEGKAPSISRYLFIVPLATAAGFVFGAIEQTEMALLPIFGIKGGYGEASAAWMLVVLGLGHVFCQIPLGIWSDRVQDRRTILLICTVVGIAGSLSLPFLLPYPFVLYSTIFFFGGVIGGLYTVGLAHLGSRLKGAELAQANAAFVMCYAFGMLVGPQLVGMTMDGFGVNGFGWGCAAFFTGYLALYIARRSTRTR